MSNSSEIIIVGGGVAGCSIAYHLAKRGVKSTILERESIAARASGKAWAVISTPSALRLFERENPEHSMFSIPEGDTVAHWIDLFSNTYARIRDIAQDLKQLGGIDIELGHFPIDMVALTDEQVEMCKGDLAGLNKQGVWDIHWIDAEEIFASYPDANPKIKGGLRTPVYQVEPYKYTLGYAQAAEKMGARVKQGEAVGFGTKGGRIISVKLKSGKELGADAVVIAMGPWTCEGTAWLGKEIPIQLVLESCLRMEVSKSMPLHAISDGVYAIVPRVGGKEVILGSAGIPHLRQDHWGTALSEDHKIEIMEACVALIPYLEDAKLIEYRGDLQGWAPGDTPMKPVLGRIPEWENGYVAARLGTLGMCQSAGVGQCMADLIVDGDMPFGFKQMMDYLSPAKVISK